MLGVGVTTLVSHAAGQKDRDRAVLVFNESLLLSALVGVVFFAIGMARADAVRDRACCRSNDGAAGRRLPALVHTGDVAAVRDGGMGAALRGTGNFKPGMVVQTATIIINIVLAPFLIFGWGTGRPLGVAGAAISSLVAIVVGVDLARRVLSGAELVPEIRARRGWTPDFPLWRKILGIGLPAGAEFALMAVYLVIVYDLSRPFGSAAQAGFGIGMRVLQAGFMPVVALGFSVAPVAGQNFGARQPSGFATRSGPAP